MGAKTKWWYCGRCGFANHPRPTAVPVYELVPGTDQYKLVSGDSKCEQCGAGQAEKDALDYTPVGV